MLFLSRHCAPSLQEWDHYPTGTLDRLCFWGGSLHILSHPQGNDPSWQEKLPLSWEALLISVWKLLPDHMWSLRIPWCSVRTDLTWAALMFGNIWKNKEEYFFFPFHIPSSVCVGRVEEDGPRTEGCKPWSWGQRGGLLWATSRGGSERLHLPLECVPPYNFPFFGGPEVKGWRCLWWGAR